MVKGPSWKPAKGEGNYGKMVSTAAKQMAALKKDMGMANKDSRAGSMKPLTPKMPTMKKMR